MSNFLSRQESVLPPGFRLQVIFNDGKPETIPMGTNSTVSYLGGLSYREKMAGELRILMQEAYGLNPSDLRTLCFDLEGNEVVVIRSVTKPKNDWNRQLQTKQNATKLLGSADDVIDI